MTYSRALRPASGPRLTVDHGVRIRMSPALQIANHHRGSASKSRERTDLETPSLTAAYALLLLLLVPLLVPLLVQLPSGLELGNRRTENFSQLLDATEIDDRLRARPVGFCHPAHAKGSCL